MRYFQEPYFTPMDLNGGEDDFIGALTDDGTCNVYNGRALLETYSSSVTKISELANVTDPRASFAHKMINGTGPIYAKSFWINVADR